MRIVDALSQTPQPGGYWLIHAHCPPGQAPIVGVRFHLHNAAHIPLALFQQQPDRLELLSRAPLPDSVLNSQAPWALHQEGGCTLPSPVNVDTPTLLLGSDLGIAPLLYLGKHYAQSNRLAPWVALLHASEDFPFAVKPARYLLPNSPAEAIGSCALLEDWHLPNRLASEQGRPGCYEGSLSALFAYWLEAESHSRRAPPNPSESPLPVWQVMAFLPAETHQACLALSARYDWIEWQTPQPFA